MKPIHWLSIAGTVIAIGLFAAGFSKMAGIVCLLTILLEFLHSVITGKRSNDGTR